MAGTKIACRGCGRPIEISRVYPPAGDTVPWSATVPPRHTVLYVFDDLVYFRCSTGDSYVVQLPQRGAIDDPRERKLQILERKIAEADDPDLRRALEDRWHELADPGVMHMSWLQYHAQLVNEYFDVDAEWALIKEICPEVEKAALTAKPSRQERRRRKGIDGVEAVTLSAWYAAASLGFAFGFRFAGWLILGVALVLSSVLLLRR